MNKKDLSNLVFCTAAFKGVLGAWKLMIFCIFLGFFVKQGFSIKIFQFFMFCSIVASFLFFFLCFFVGASLAGIVNDDLNDD